MQMNLLNNILLTGGAGFIGSSLADRLLERQEVSVINLDNFNDFYDSSIKRANIAGVMDLDRYKLIEGDIRDEDLVNNTFKSFKPDAVIHIAAMAGVRPSIKDPMLYQDVNIRGTMLLLEAARKFGVKRFIFASSSSVYGNLEEAPFSEDAKLSRPVSPYAATKLAGEGILYTYHHLYSLPAIALRFFTVYGPRQRPEMAIHKFTRAIFNSDPIELYGDSLISRRDYTYIDDILDGVCAALDSDIEWGIYNLGNSSTVQLQQLVTLLQEIIGIEADVSHAPWQPGDVIKTFADLTNSSRDLGYLPRISIEDGLRRFVSWYSENRQPPQV